MPCARFGKPLHPSLPPPPESFCAAGGGVSGADGAREEDWRFLNRLDGTGKDNRRCTWWMVGSTDYEDACADAIVFQAIQVGAPRFTRFTRFTHLPIEIAPPFKQAVPSARHQARLIFFGGGSLPNSPGLHALSELLLIPAHVASQLLPNGLWPSAHTGAQRSVQKHPSDASAANTGTSFCQPKLAFNKDDNTMYNMLGHFGERQEERAGRTWLGGTRLQQQSCADKSDELGVHVLSMGLS